MPMAPELQFPFGTIWVDTRHRDVWVFAGERQRQGYRGAKILGVNRPREVSPAEHRLPLLVHPKISIDEAEQRASRLKLTLLSSIRIRISRTGRDERELASREG